MSILVEKLLINNIHCYNSQEDQEASPSSRPDSTGAHSAKEEEDDPFWGLDDIPGRFVYVSVPYSYEFI